MKITRDEVRRIAALSCLEFDEAGEERMAEEMSRILDYVDEIREAACIDDLRFPETVELRLRDDIAAASLPAEEVERAAPRFANGHFVVPKVIGSE